MKEKISYIAFDGKEFETKEECEAYENESSVKAYREQITVLDDCGEEILEWWEDDGSDFFGLYFATKEAREAFKNHFSEYMPWDGNYYNPQDDGKISFVGTHWVYFDDEEWHCLEKDLELAQNKYNEWIKYFK